MRQANENSISYPLRFSAEEYGLLEKLATSTEVARRF
jgi:hypothetical protein